MSQSPRIVSVVGARPQFVKLAPISRSFLAHGCVDHRVIHTGQHYDAKMSAVFFDELELPKPDLDLGVGSGGHGAQTGAMLERLESAFLEQRPDAVLVFGDTNSTLAATLAATKLHVPVAHIEAGLRSFNREMPEEINRIVADHCCDRLYAPTPVALQNLLNENLNQRAVLSGDVMRDAVLYNRKLAEQKSNIRNDLGIRDSAFALLTIHRPVNTTVKALRKILTALEEIANSTLPMVFPVHPRTRPLVDDLGYRDSAYIRIIEPLPYLDMIQLVESAQIVITDSGGVQKEAAFLETPCVTLREETEWTETVDLGVNTLVGQESRKIKDVIEQYLSGENPFSAAVVSEMDRHYGAGKAADGIVEDLLRWQDARTKVA